MNKYMMISCPCPQIDARIKHQVSCFISNFGGLIALHSQGERIPWFLAKGKNYKKRIPCSFGEIIVRKFLQG